jgi:hypothetical protein
VDLSAEASYLGETQSYEIADGKIVTDLVGTPIEIAVYKLGDTYFGARSNEYGYANYTMVPAQPELSPLSAAPGMVAPK